jgi:phosphoribosylformylglycinamidine cyclo-ligase
MAQNADKNDPSRYASRGVSASKAEVHAAVDKLDSGLFPGAFCKITPDYLTGDSSRCAVTHSDGSGTKVILAYLWWKETGDAKVFRGIAQDSVIMNIDDLLCVGATKKIILSSTLNRNSKKIPGEIISEIINGTEEILSQLRDQGLEIYSGGGETADMGDLTPTLTVDSTATSLFKRDEVINADHIVPGLVIVGISSSGKASYEKFENSGIGSNGLTSARHELLSHYYAEKYPETFDHAINKSLVYCGPHRLDTPLANSTMSVGAALLSPTRTYTPLVIQLIKELGTQELKGLIHCSGGALVKCLRFGKSVHYIKDNLFTPPLFSERLLGSAAPPSANFIRYTIWDKDSKSMLSLSELNRL